MHKYALICIYMYINFFFNMFNFIFWKNHNLCKIIFVYYKTRLEKYWLDYNGDCLTEVKKLKKLKISKLRTWIVSVLSWVSFICCMIAIGLSNKYSPKFQKKSGIVKFGFDTYSAYFIPKQMSVIKSVDILTTIFFTFFAQNQLFYQYLQILFACSNKY